MRHNEKGELEGAEPPSTGCILSYAIGSYPLNWLLYRWLVAVTPSFYEPQAGAGAGLWLLLSPFTLPLGCVVAAFHVFGEVCSWVGKTFG